MEIQRDHIGAMAVLRILGEPMSQSESSVLVEEADWCRGADVACVVIDCSSVRWLGQCLSVSFWIFDGAFWTPGSTSGS